MNFLMSAMMKIESISRLVSYVVLTISGCLTSVALADTTIVDENFESYANDAALYSVWQPWDDSNSGNTPTFPDDGVLENGGNVPTAFPAEGGDGLGGTQGVDHIGDSVLQYVPALGDGGNGAAIVPTELQSIVLRGDIFDTGATGNKRLTIGLRNRTSSSNLLELGFYNSSEPDTGYSYRMILYPSTVENPNPNWQPIELDASLDRVDDEDDFVNPADIGEAWHRYQATITPTTITVEFDLFRDGLNNATNEAGNDFSETIEITTSADGYDSLRIGGPSSITSPGNEGVIFDNIFLGLVDVVGGGGLEGDYNGNLIVDAADYTIWRDTLGDTVVAGEGADGNGNESIDLGDYEVWKNNFGMTAATAANSVAASAVPEPMTLGLLFVFGSGLLSRRRR